jgi:hypothetical protein
MLVTTGQLFKIMAIVINGSGTITGLSVGGLPDGTVDTDTLASSVSLGITEVDMWVLDTAFSGSKNPIDDWARFAGASNLFKKKGTGMSHSSGVFSFPSTGLYRIYFNWNHLAVADDDLFMVEINVDPGTGSYGTVGQIKGSSWNDDDNYQTVGSEIYVNVANTSSWHVKFAIGNADGKANTSAGTTNLETYCTFQKLSEVIS